ncbi:hypothetical protein D3C84_964140 [compost metagenome]
MSCRVAGLRLCSCIFEKGKLIKKLSRNNIRLLISIKISKNRRRLSVHIDWFTACLHLHWLLVDRLFRCTGVLDIIHIAMLVPGILTPIANPDH